MISVTKLLGGASYFGDRLRYHEHSAKQTTGARPGSGPVVVWNATKTCNLECVHCYADAEIRKFSGELSTEEAKRMIEDLASINCPALLISGGEPLVRPDILDLAEYATSLGVRFTVTQDNVGDIDSIFRFVEQENIGRLCLYHLVYAGRGSYLQEIDQRTDEKRELMDKLILQVDKWNAEGREIEVMTVDNHADAPFIYMWLLENDPARAEAALTLVRNNGGNRSGIAIGCIDSFGFVHPDQFTSHHTVGSIREKKFSQIWTDGRVDLLQDLRNRKALLKGRCTRCTWLPVCNGNFRARAEAATGDYWQSDPGCYLLDSEIHQEVAF
jgi:radical SAM protein with 4Fe4S-binding SPASM domain